MTKTPSATRAAKAQAKSPRGRRAAKPHPDDMNQATVDEFEREGLGVAAKE